VVCHHPLYFDTPWLDNGFCSGPVIGSVAGALALYANTLLLPARVVISPPWLWECEGP
jgi:hypothetical protein